MARRSVYGLNGSGFYYGSILQGVEELGPDLLDITCLVVVLQQDNIEQVRRELANAVSEFVDIAMDFGQVVESTGEYFAVKVVINDRGERRFTWQPSDICAERKALAQKLLAEFGSFC